MLRFFCRAGFVAQNAAQRVWQGVLHNAAGAPIAGAKIRLTASGARLKQPPASTDISDSRRLPAGQYHLTVEAKGRKIEFGQPVDLAAAAPAVSITLSEPR